MANPRQRRKARSSIGKLSKSKQSTKNSKKVNVRGPAAIVDAWDVKKTLRQNYAAMGLLSSMNPRQKGGVEPVKVIKRLEGDEQELQQQEVRLGPNGEIPRGYAKITRDKEGNIVDVVFADEEGFTPAATQEQSGTVWGQPLNSTNRIDEDEWSGITATAVEESGLDQPQGIPMPHSQHKGGDGIHIQNYIKPPTSTVQGKVLPLRFALTDVQG